MTRQWRRLTGLLLAAVLIAAAPGAAIAAWEPTKPIEFVVPAGTGGGADQMARLIAGLAEKQKLSPKPLIVVNKSGGAGAERVLTLVGKMFDSTANKPIECVIHCKAGLVRPLAVFDSARIPVTDWKDIPTVKEALGADITYLMLRGIFGPPDMPKEAVAWYQGLLKKVMETPEFKAYMNDGALKPAWLTGPELSAWMEKEDKVHQELMAQGGLLKK